MNIKLVETAEERQQVYRLRYEVYVDEMGLNPPDADHSRRIITDEFDGTGRILAAFSDGEVIGTLRVNLAAESDMGEWMYLLGMEHLGPFFPQRASLSSRLVVAPEFRSGMLGLRLCKTAFRLDYDLGTRFETMCCHARQLGLFHRLGFRQTLPSFDLEGFGESYPMVLCMADTEYLARMGSPLLSALPSQVQDYGSVKFFYEDMLREAVAA